MVDRVLNAATMNKAAEYASEEYRAAQDAYEQLEAELEAQEASWLPSYGRTRELAAAAFQAATVADEAALETRERVRDETSELVAEASSLLDEAREHFAAAEGRRRPAIDVEATRTELEDLASTLARVSDLLGNDEYGEARALANSAKESAEQLKTRLE